MMKLATKFLAVGAVAAFAVAMSVASSQAAKRTATPKTCGAMGALCSTNCANGWCSVMTCGADGNWIAAILTPICPQSTCINVKKKC